MYFLDHHKCVAKIDVEKIKKCIGMLDGLLTKPQIQQGLTPPQSLSLPSLTLPPPPPPRMPDPPPVFDIPKKGLSEGLPNTKLKKVDQIPEKKFYLDELKGKLAYVLVIILLMLLYYIFYFIFSVKDDSVQ